MRKVKVTCLDCNESDILTIDDTNHQLLYNEKVMLSPIISVRWRKDLKWGYECRCGNYDLLAEEEKRDFNKLVAGSADRVAEIANMLKQKTKNRFSVEGV